VSRWGPDGPPPEAYSRVTDAERFRQLHDIALALIARLASTFDVDGRDGYGQGRLDPRAPGALTTAPNQRSNQRITRLAGSRVAASARGRPA